MKSIKFNMYTLSQTEFYIFDILIATNYKQISPLLTNGQSSRAKFGWHQNGLHRFWCSVRKNKTSLKKFIILLCKTDWLGKVSFFLMLALLRTASFRPPSKVYISVIITHIFHQFLQYFILYQLWIANCYKKLYKASE